jgi:hypothetical protein
MKNVVHITYYYESMTKHMALVFGVHVYRYDSDATSWEQLGQVNSGVSSAHCVTQVQKKSES